MRRSTILKLLVTTIVSLLICLVYKYFWKEDISVKIILISLACVLPITFLVKFPGKR